MVTWQNLSRNWHPSHTIIYLQLDRSLREATFWRRGNPLLASPQVDRHTYLAEAA